MARVPASPHVVSVLSHRAATRQVSADGHTAYDIVFLDLSPDDSPLALPTVQAALGPAPGRRRGARRRAGLLRRRADRVGDRPPAQRGDLAAARRARPDRRLRQPRRGGRPARRRWLGGRRRAGGHLRAGEPHPDEHLRAQPGHPARAGARRRLLAPAHEPLPGGARRTCRVARDARGSGPRPCPRRGRRDRRPDHGRHRGSGGLLLGADRAPRPDRARSCSSS